MTHKRFIELVFQYPLSLPLHENEDYFLIPTRIASSIGLEPEIFTLDASGGKERLSSGIEVRKFKSIAHLLFSLKRSSPTLVHGHSFGWIPAMLAPIFCSKYVLTPHIYKLSIYNQTKVKIASRIISGAEAIIALTDHEKTEIQEYVKKDNVVVIPHPIDVNFFSSKLEINDDIIRRQYGLTDQQVITCVANLIPRKNIETLIKAVSILRKEELDFRLIIVGGSPKKVLSESLSADYGNAYHEFLISLIRNLNLENKVIFTGHLDPYKLREIFHISSILCLPSRIEGQSLTAGEAAAAGVPLILSDIEPLREIFGNCALFHPANDENILAKHISRVLGEDDLRKKMIKAGKEMVKNYDIAAIVPKLKKLYSEVVS